MKRSLYPNSVEVDQTHLAYTESTKSEQLLDRTLAIAQVGIISGLAVTINGLNNQQIDVTPGQVVVPNGELAVVTAPVVGLALADNTLNVVNLVLVLYSETPYQPEPSENGVTIENTLVSAAGSVVVLTQAQYTALSTAQKAVHELIASITATGVAIGAIDQSTPYINVIAPSQPVSIIGVEITGIDYTTSAGTGLLEFDAAPATGVDVLVPTPRIRWTAPGEGSAGTFVNIPINGTYTLLSNAGRSLTIRVISVILPLVDVSDFITVTALYNRPIPRFTAADALHRTYVGSGVPSPTNPHGMTFADFGGSASAQVDAHQLLAHSNGIRRGSATSFLSTAVVPVAGFPPDYISIVGPVPPDTYFVNGKTLLTLGAATVTFTAGVSSNVSLYDVYLDEAGNPARSLRTEFPPGVGHGLAVADIDEGTISGSFNLVHTRTAAGSTLVWNGGPSVLIRASGNYRLHGSDGKWVLVNVGAFGGPDLGFSTLTGVNGVYTDTITVAAPTDRKMNFLIASVVFNGNTGDLGWTEALINPRQTIDKRMFGMLGLPEIRDDALLLNSGHAGATLTVGDGRTSFGDYNGANAIQTAANLLTTGGLIVVKSGIYDPFTISNSNTSVEGVGLVSIDGLSAAASVFCINIAASRVRLKNLKLLNATSGITQTSGDDGQGENILFGTGLTANLTWIAGARNHYASPVKQLRTVIADAALTPFDEWVLVDATLGPVVLTLPLSTNCANILHLKKKDVTTNLVTAVKQGADTIDFTTEVGTDVYLDTITLEPTLASGWLR